MFLLGSAQRCRSTCVQQANVWLHVHVYWFLRGIYHQLGNECDRKCHQCNATAADAEFTKSWWNWWGTGSQTSSTTSSSTDSGSANKNWQSALSKMAAETNANAAKTAKAGTKLGTAGIVGIVLASVAVGFGVAGLLYRKVQKNRAAASIQEPMLEKEQGILA